MNQPSFGLHCRATTEQGQGLDPQQTLLCKAKISIPCCYPLKNEKITETDCHMLEGRPANQIDW